MTPTTGPEHSNDSESSKAFVPADQKKIWNYFQAHHTSAFDGAATRLFYLARLIPGYSRVLNIGVGSAQLEQLAQAMGHSTISLDPDTESLANGRAKVAGLQVTGMIQEIPLKSASVDVVVVSEVFEHLEQEIFAKGLGEISRVLKPGGTLIGTVPHDENLGLSIVVCPCCGSVFHKVGHIQSFTCESMKSALENQFIRVKTYRRAFMNTSNLSRRKRALAAVRNALVLSGIFTRELTLVFEAKKPR